MFNFKKIILILAIILIVSVAIFFFAFLTIFIIPMLIILMACKKMIFKNKNKKKGNRDNFYYQSRNNNVIDVDYKKLGDIFSEKLNLACGPVACLLPKRGISILDGDGELFCDRAADAAFATQLKKKLKSDICVEELDYNINDPVFATRAVDMLLELMTF